jgi:hypothetical protein
MPRRVAVESVGIRLADRPDLGREIGRVLHVHRLAHAQQGHDVIVGRALRAGHGGERAPRGEEPHLDRLEIVFGMGPRQTVGGVGVGLPEDVGDAPGVAEDSHVALGP